MLKTKGYIVTVGEMGINLSKSEKRGADISIFKAGEFVAEPKFADNPPEVIIEIGVQAEIEPPLTEMEYVSDKIKDYLAFGVKNVIWIFSKNKLIIEATEKKPWLMQDWATDIEAVEGVHFNMAKMQR